MRLPGLTLSTSGSRRSGRSRQVARRRIAVLVAATAASGALVLPSPASAAGSSGKGTLTVSPSTAVAGTTLQPVFTFTSNGGGTYGTSSSLTITVPAGWTTPSLTPSNAGYTTAASGNGCTAGAVSVSGQVITVAMSCSSNGTLTVSYSANTTGTHAATTNVTGSSTFSATTKDAGDSAAVALTSGSPIITVTPATASKLAVTTQPSGGSAGTAWGTQPAVAVQDTYGNTVTSSTAPVALNITAGTGTAGANSTCTNPVTPTSGVASFTGCAIDKVGTGYTLTATSAGLTSAVSLAFPISLGTANKLAFTTSPSGSTGGVAFATQPVVTVQDAGGNTVTGDTSSVSLAVNGSTGMLTCTASSKAASSGVATFSGCAIDKAGTYTLTATDGTLTSATASVTITVGPAVKLGFNTQPNASSTSGLAFSTQPVVAAQDAGGNAATTYAGSVTLTLSGSGPSGATLTCTANPKSASTGLASFAGCAVDKSGSGYTLTANDGMLSAAISSAFAITAGASAKLVFSTQPSGSTGGASFTSQPVVTVQDANGNTVTTDASSVTLAITNGTGTTGAMVSCTSNAKAASSGVVAFTGCSINKAGIGYTLRAIDGSLAFATSTAFTITVGPASKLVLTTQPTAGSSIIAGSTFPVMATEQDAGGNTITSDSTTVVSLTLASGTGLSCPGAPSALTSGTASFTCSLTLATGGYSLKAAAGSVTTTGTTFSVTPAAASRLTYTAQPAGTTAGTVLATFSSAVLDTYGNTVTTGTGSSDTIVLTVASGPGPFAAASTVSVPAAAGVATFSNVSFTTAGAYVLTATDSTRTIAAATSNSFTITAAAAGKLNFVQAPSDAFAGAAMTPGVSVQIQDNFGNATATNGVAVTLTPSAGVINSGATATTGTSGLATFSAVLINNTALGLTLGAAATGYVATPASAAINITAKVTDAANALSDAAADPGTNASAVATVTYYYCSGLSGACAAGTPGRTQIATPVTSSTGTYTTAWSSQPANGPYRVVAVAVDNAGNVSSVSTPTLVTIAN